jgi:hypothetical protein
MYLYFFFKEEKHRYHCLGPELCSSVSHWHHWTKKKKRLQVAWIAQVVYKFPQRFDGVKSIDWIPALVLNNLVSNANTDKH